MAEVKQTQMIFKSSIITEFKKTAIKNIDSVTIGNSKAFEALFGDNEKYEFISVTKFGEKFPADLDPWTQIILTKEWADSFAEKVNKIPKPVFVPGHKETGIGYKERAIPDGYLVGAMVKDNILYLRNSLPEGETDNQRALINQTLKEINAGMLSTSLTDVMKYKIVIDAKNHTEMYYAIESLKGQTNALVEEDQTASEAEIIITSFKAKIDSNGEKEEGVKQMGEEKIITNAEMYTVLKNQLESGHLALKDVASGLGVELMTTKQKAALKRLNDAESNVGDITEFVTKIVADHETAFKALKEAKIKDKFKTDELIEIATPLFALKEGTVEEIDTEVERVSGLKVFKAIQGKLAGNMNYQPGSGDNENIDIDNDDEVMEG